MDKPKDVGGRPSDYTKELADDICAQLAEGKSLRTVCLPDEMPSKTTIFNWMRTKDGFLDQYTRAKEESADAMFEETIDIADDGANDWMENNDPENAGYKFNGEHIQRSKLRVDTRKWMMSKMKPKKYGDRITTEHTGNVGVTDLSADQLDAKLNALLNAQNK